MVSAGHQPRAGHESAGSQRRPVIVQVINNHIYELCRQHLNYHSYQHVQRCNCATEAELTGIDELPVTRRYGPSARFERQTGPRDVNQGRAILASLATLNCPIEANEYMYI
jgi:hypothetical protein